MNTSYEYGYNYTNVDDQSEYPGTYSPPSSSDEESEDDVTETSSKVASKVEAKDVAKVESKSQSKVESKVQTKVNLVNNIKSNIIVSPKNTSKPNITTKHPLHYINDELDSTQQQIGNMDNERDINVLKNDQNDQTGEDEDEGNENSTRENNIQVSDDQKSRSSASPPSRKSKVSKSKKTETSKKSKTKSSKTPKDSKTKKAKKTKKPPKDTKRGKVSRSRKSKVVSDESDISNDSDDNNQDDNDQDDQDEDDNDEDDVNEVDSRSEVSDMSDASDDNAVNTTRQISRSDDPDGSKLVHDKISKKRNRRSQISQDKSQTSPKQTNVHIDMTNIDDAQNKDRSTSETKSRGSAVLSTNQNTQVNINDVLSTKDDAHQHNGEEKQKNDEDKKEQHPDDEEESSTGKAHKSHKSKKKAKAVSNGDSELNLDETKSEVKASTKSGTKSESKSSKSKKSSKVSSEVDDNGNPVAPVKRKPGRPPKQSKRVLNPKKGIINKPQQDTSYMEFIYDNPLIFKKISQFFKSMAAENIHTIFRPNEIIMYTKDHTQKSHIRVRINASMISRYYIKNTLEVGMSAKSLENIMNKIDKDYVDIIFVSKLNSVNKSIALTLKNEMRIDEQHDIDVVGQYDKMENENEFLDENYTIKFELPGKYFKKTINDIKSISDQLTITQTDYNKPLLFKYNAGDKKTKVTHIVTDREKIKFNSKLKEHDMFKITVNTEYIKPISSSQLAEAIQIYIDENKKMMFKAMLDNDSIEIKVLTSTIEERK